MKPRIIAHRANLNGPNPSTENTLDAIQICMWEGLDIELDIWYIDGKYFLGHDSPKTEFDFREYKFELDTKLYLHAKTIETLQALLKMQIDIYGHDCFIHDKDIATLTFCNKIWTYPGQELFKSSIVVMPEYQPRQYRDQVKELYLNEELYGICTDFPLEWLELQKEKDNVRK